MAEGRTKVWYESDLLTVFDDAGAGAPALLQFREPNNLIAQAALGWITATPTTVPSGLGRPAGFRPRHVVGVSPSGDRVRAICATTTCDLWTGVASTWTYIDNSGATITATRTGRVGESARG